MQRNKTKQKTNNTKQQQSMRVCVCATNIQKLKRKICCATSADVDIDDILDDTVRSGSASLSAKYYYTNIK